MKGGGAGCNYPGESFSGARMWYHHLVFYGFLLDFAATTVAAFYDHFLGWQAPYPYFSAPVVLGTVGGVGLLIGTVGLLYLKWKSDRAPADASMQLMIDLVREDSKVAQPFSASQIVDFSFLERARRELGVTKP